MSEEKPKKTKRKTSVVELKEQAAENLAGWKRALADYDNLKRDLSKERDETRRYVIEGVAEGFLVILDHFDQATKHRPDLDSCDEETKKKVNGWIDGVSYIRSAMVEELKGYGVQAIEPAVGDEYDPQTHESIGSREDEEADDQTILEVSARGWRLGDKMIRSPKVIINEKTNK